MDQLTKDFFRGKFPGLAAPIKIQDDILATNLPVAEVNLDINTDSLLSLAKQIPVDDVVRPTYMYEEYPRSQGWGMQLLWSDGTVVPWIKDLYYKKFIDAVPEKLATGTAKTISDLLFEYGISAKVCWLSKFSPGGYLRPHRDISLNPQPLTYFWLPLNNPSGSELKVYPTGTVDIKLGSVYLLNQENYTHAVINHSDEDRYVLVGHFSNNLSQSLMSKIKASILDKY